MRIRPNHARVHHRGALPRAHVGDGFAHHAQAGEEIRAVDRRDVQAGERRQQARHVPAGSLDLDRDRNRIAVVFDEIEERQPPGAGGVERLPELALAGRALAERCVDDLVALESRFAIGDRFDALVDDARFRPADGMEHLRGGRARSRHDVERLVPPVRRHLASAVAGIGRRADRREQHLERRHAELQAQRAVAIVGVEPVVTGFQRQACRDQHRLMPGAADLEERAALILELDFLVVETARSHHHAVDIE